jgi:hypothetical protein
LFCSFSFLLSLAMLCYLRGRACPNFELFDPSECKEVAVSLAFANFDGSADHVSRDRQTEFLRAGPKHSQFSDKLLLRYHRCTFDIFPQRQQTPVAPSLAHRERRIFAGGVGRKGRHVGHKSSMDRACRDPALLAARRPTSDSPLKTAHPFGPLST